MTKTGDLKFIFLMFFFFTSLSWAAATGVRVESIVDRNQMGMGDTLTLTLSVSSVDSVDVSEPRLQNLNDFDLVNSWTSSSTSSKLIQSGGGMKFETVRRQDFNYMITPKKSGRLTIPSFEVNVDNKNYATKPVGIDVSKQGSGAATPPKNLGGFQAPDEEALDEADAAMLQQLMGRNAPSAEPQVKNLPKNANEVLSVHVEVDKSEVFEGEQIVANWYIYTRGNLLSLDRVKFPDLKGFWKEIIEEVPSLNFTQEVINGLPYRKALLASHALFPIKSGLSIIDEYKVKGQVQIPSNPFSNFAFGPTYSFQRASERIKVNVKPLPVDGKPQDFSGAVGVFDVRASVEAQSYPVNQPFVFKLRFEGSGNAKLIELPNLNLPAGIELYNSKSESKYFKNGRSYKEFEVLLIPRQEGKIHIPALKFSMFDPGSKKYISRSTEAVDVQVVSNPNASTGPSSRLSLQGPAGTQAEPAKNALPDLVMQWDRNSSRSLATPWMWVLAFASALSALGWKTRKELFGVKTGRDLKAVIQKRLKAIRIDLGKNDFRKVGTQSINAMNDVLGEVSGLGGAGTEIHRLLDQAPPSLRRDFGSEISSLIEIFQTLSFAPEEALGNLKDPQDLQKNVARLEKILWAMAKKSQDDQS